MFYNGFEIRGEVIMGEVHVTLRARRFDDCTGAAWDHLYRGVSKLAGGAAELDWLAVALSYLLEDIAFYTQCTEESLQGSHRLEASR